MRELLPRRTHPRGYNNNREDGTRAKFNYKRELTRAQVDIVHITQAAVKMKFWLATDLVYDNPLSFIGFKSDLLKTVFSYLEITQCKMVRNLILNQ